MTVLVGEVKPSIGGVIVGPDQLGALEALEDLETLCGAQRGFQAALRQDQDVRASSDRDVVQRGMDGGPGVPGQRPWGGGPDQQTGLFRQTEVTGMLQWKADEDRGVLDVLIAQAHLGRRKRRPAAGTEGHDLVTQVQQVLVPQALQGPPDALDVVIGHRHVGVIQVHPEGDPLGHASPGALVGHDRLPALPVEGLDPVLLDCLLA